MYPQIAQNPPKKENMHKLKKAFSGLRNPNTPVSDMLNSVPSTITVRITKTTDYIIICQ